MKQLSRRVKRWVLIVAVAMGASATWTNEVARTDSESRHRAETEALLHLSWSVHSVADLFPPGR
jgi:hypothetical protein